MFISLYFIHYDMITELTSLGVVLPRFVTLLLHLLLHLVKTERDQCVA